MATEVSFADARTPVLIVVHSNTFFIEMYRVAHLLKHSDRYRPIVLFSCSYPTVALDIAKCVRDDLVCIDEQGARIASSPDFGASDSAPVAPRIFGFIRSLVRGVRSGCRAVLRLLDQALCGGFFSCYRLHRARQRFALKILQETGCRLLVMAGDIVGYDTADFVKVAHALEIAVVLVPSTMSNGMEQAEAYYHNSRYQLVWFYNRLAAWLFPRWVRQHRERKLLRRPAADVFAMELLGTAPPLPWIFNSGFADVIAAESEAMIEYYLAGGIPASQVVLTGSLANDELARYRDQAPLVRPRLLRELSLSPERPVLLTALPPDFLYLKGGRPECDFKTYGALVDFWMSVLHELTDWNIVLSLHPSADPAAMRHLETERIKIGPRNTASLVPLCDLFMASVSSTIRWAIACGKPVVNYDVYRYRYSDYLRVPGVLIMEEQHEVRDTLRRLTSEPAYLERIRQQQQSCASHWGVLDGKTGERLLALFDSFSQSHPGRSLQQVA